MDEQFCSICGHEGTEDSNNSNSTVLIICDNCLKSDELIHVLDKLMLLN